MKNIYNPNDPLLAALEASLANKGKKRIANVDGIALEAVNTLAAIEARQANPIASILHSNHNRDAWKTFCYSKVLNAMKLSKEAEIQFKPEPWLNCIAYDDYIVAYVWDNREIIFTEKNPEACRHIRSLEIDECTQDVYHSWDKKPLLVAKYGVEKDTEIAKLGNTWIQPWITIAQYQIKNITQQGGKVIKQIEYEIFTRVPSKNDLQLIGEYIVQDLGGNKYKSAIMFSIDLVKDFWPEVNSKAEKSWFRSVQNRPQSFVEIQNALLEGLTM